MFFRQIINCGLYQYLFPSTPSRRVDEKFKTLRRKKNPQLEKAEASESAPSAPREQTKHAKGVWMKNSTRSGAKKISHDKKMKRASARRLRCGSKQSTPKACR
jgi:hypothetical protein